MFYLYLYLSLFIHVVTKHVYRSYQMMRKDLYMIALASQVYKEKMEGQLVLLGYVYIQLVCFLQYPTNLRL